ncbi:MAG: hypothetical protein LQ348_005399 [Seirophora lacunosa]|nr:MAG: hypothetical protein LQ344_005428 [Seirophora lacunosa]KAI4179427.1 MAG: hypothetical protein LQ348_005399 [Seirophora lacunosa]
MGNSNLLVHDHRAPSHEVMAYNATANQQPQANSIWTRMNYVPPRGPCAQKLSMISSCPCFRFMLNPLKAATSFECDGCGHHASFHKMESREDEETVSRWKEDARRLEFSRSVLASYDKRTNAETGIRAPARREIQDRITVESSDEGLVAGMVENQQRTSKRRRKRDG